MCKLKGIELIKKKIMMKRKSREKIRFWKLFKIIFYQVRWEKKKTPIASNRNLTDINQKYILAIFYKEILYLYFISLDVPCFLSLPLPLSFFHNFNCISITCLFRVLISCLQFKFQLSSSFVFRSSFPVMFLLFLSLFFFIFISHALIN